ncbi:di-trans,poly-cis-decaprenylcistransferase [Moraxella bovis]|uniref:Ditrans,polycis-undecaprenyl-diphosphate synthase ((2E,6E)-farnesyl-diphosphate specific) n=1 Tax=Moraxella bovis TaxID=476 RepID=A0AAQ2Q3V8_MORBO|nr:polyprenyl diphosphate synthase [Moraxella bovis]AWY19582.1 di-trans,poly-cis-decaprenylcistransferase [Moraxella bovis]UYZ75297.1 di-trans,poly-cis-decaprenylcistransferase [Moraxella bovis]UYZ78770.1 di-trans,poly-cis-decaprenylcistransferase [Moraxella bovis]UYZ80649.1 di-trans,poly-cis-decaprenylcistransferase [Moraxella bovis]UYZ87252.1 di-trans,poly-cis-decaprenylcistransferase [Moraxella bovis]
MPNAPLPPILSLPQHIAIIMDGNNRYGKAHALQAGAGHIKGKDAIDPIVEHCLARGVKVLTVFAFSSENWARPQAEVALLMRLLESTIHEQMPRMNKYQIRLRFIGDRSMLNSDLQALMTDAENKTAHFDKMTLVIAISYGGQWDIAQACQKLAIQVQKGELNPNDVNARLIGQNVELADLPDVDMLIRTGGEWRISNFLLWQSAYAELFFTDTLWPDFGADELDKMIQDFGNRERRFGKTSEQVQGES